MVNLVAFLQNAWSPAYAGRKWPRESWLKALHRSRSGQRIRVMTAECPDAEIWWDNTTPICGDHPDSVIPPDLGHMRKVIRERRPTIILAMGGQAATALRKLQPDCSVLMLPHPAYRVLTNDLYRRAGELIQGEFSGWIALHQHRDKVHEQVEKQPRSLELR